MPFLLHVHWPNKALPSNANLDVPHPLSFAACARAIETGIISILIFNVDKSFGDVKALKGVSAQIMEGEFFSLLGPSGCGKTTLLRTIAGFEDLTGGVVLIDGKDLEGVLPNNRPANMVFQSYAIFPHLNVGENVAFGLRRKKLSLSEMSE